MGNGFAVLDIQERPNKKYEKLDHHVPWCGDQDDLIYINFDQMPLYCSQYHEAGHTREICPRNQCNNQGCFNCGDKTHFADACPFTKAKELWTPGGGKRNRHKTGGNTNTFSSSLKGSKCVVDAAPVPCSKTNSFSPLTEGQDQEIKPTPSLSIGHKQLELNIEDSGDMVIDKVGDSAEFHKLGFIEQKMDNAILSFIETDYKEINENIKEKAQTLNLVHSWMD